MRLYSLWLGLVWLGALAGCQSTRLATRLPAEAAPSYQHSSIHPVKPTEVVATQPELTASVSPDTATAGQTPNQALVKSRPVYHRGPATSPDTTLARPAVGLVPTGKPDTFTTLVNLTGLAVATGGVVGAAGAQGNYSEITRFFGVSLLLLGLALLFYQSTNGRWRLARQARRAAKQPNAPAALSPEVQIQRNLRLGKWLLLSGAFLLGLVVALAFLLPVIEIGVFTLNLLLVMLALNLLLVGSTISLLALLEGS
ncbi:hypothetical protein [Hymenobacter persicinus]|uniref:Uncharacterized protein n=1 Tax=Hymenobacter persicinus TaxID=2025506 RepID=A0A4Q5L896_9BACT|nr:hypothetical protein [Hymenobacter persicinus]RYU74075.1 hypothetical protein EWM57_20530 [Hymenobacter persicinus]RYU79960.1 hypothetical protein EWM57_09785 [Hymenobacter persicinus]